MRNIILVSFFFLIFGNSYSQNEAFLEPIEDQEVIKKKLKRIAKSHEESDFQIVFSNESSIQFEDFLLALSLNTTNPQITIKYTIDGKTPTALSAEYSSEIEINNPVSSSGSKFAVVVRAAGFLGDERVTNIKSCSYVFYKESTLNYKLPVISLITDGSNLYNADTGIYVRGTTYNGSKWSGNYFQTGIEWERDIHLTYFDENGIKQLEQDAGVRIHGGLQRNSSQKSLRFYARKEYGDKDFDYQLMPQKEKDSYKRFILRTPQGDWNNTVIKDAVGAELVRGLNIEMQDYQPVITLLNGENFGVYWIRDYIGNKHFADKYDINEDSLDIILGASGKFIASGSNDNYRDILSFVSENDLSIQENYDFVKSQIDVYDMINYYASEIYMNNYDWPSGNLRIWKSTEKDNKWRWVLYDLDAAFNGRGGFNHNTLNQASTDSDGWPNSPGTSLLFSSLLKNPTFRDEFITRSAYIAHYHFAPERVIDIIEKIKSMVEPEMGFQYDKWNTPSGSGSLNSAINSHLVAFATARGPNVQSHYTNKFSLSGMANLTLIANNEMGSIVLNDFPIPQENNSADYYKDATIRLKAIPKTGYIFDHWEGNVLLTDQSEIEIVLDNSETITAVFIKDEKEYELSINEVKSCSYDDNGDWVELLLATQDDIEFEDWFLSDDILDLNKWKLSDFSTTLSQDEEKSFLVVESTEEDTELKFSEGETVYLSKNVDNNTVTIDEITIPLIPCKLTTGITNQNTQSTLNPTKGSVNITYESSFDRVNGLFINEVLASNKNGIKDESNSYEDWIELYNGSNSDLNINELYLTDKKDNPYKHEIQLSDGVLISNDHLVLWADDDEDDGEYHLNFKLSKDGECIYLNQFIQGQLDQLDSLCFTQQLSDVSYGRTDDGSSEFVFFNTPTPNEANSFATNIITSPEISSFEVYPNPSSDLITIELLSEEKIEIYDITGILVLTSSSRYVNIQNLKAGVYLIKKGKQISRFVKE